MAKTWLNLFVAESGTSRSTKTNIDKTETVKFKDGATLRLWESAQSGAVVFDSDEHFAYGGSEVYLTIGFKDGSSKFLSAALGTDLVVKDVTSLSVSVLYPLPKGVPYQTFVNAHVVYEVL